MCIRDRCHNLGLAASGTALNPETQEVVAGAVPMNGKIACIICIASVSYTHLDVYKRQL